MPVSSLVASCASWLRLSILTMPVALIVTSRLGSRVMTARSPGHQSWAAHLGRLVAWQ